MGIPTHKQWMQDTAAGFTSPRSPRLKALDDAIMQYDKTKNPKDVWKIKNAFEDWKRYKGLTWDKGVRRSRQAGLPHLPDHAFQHAGTDGTPACGQGTEEGDC